MVVGVKSNITDHAFISLVRRCCLLGGQLRNGVWLALASMSERYHQKQRPTSL